MSQNAPPVLHPPIGSGPPGHVPVYVFVRAPQTGDDLGEVLHEFLAWCPVVPETGTTIYLGDGRRARVFRSNSQFFRLHALEGDAGYAVIPAVAAEIQEGN